MQDKEQYCNIIYKIEHYFCFLFHSYLNSLKCLSNECTNVGQRKKSKCGIGLAWVYCTWVFSLFHQSTISNGNSKTSLHVCETRDRKKTEFKLGTSLIQDRLCNYRATKLKFLQSTNSSLKFSFILGLMFDPIGYFYLRPAIYNVSADTYFAKVIVPIIKLQSTSQ